MKPFLNRKINLNNQNTYSNSRFYIISGEACFLTRKQVASCLGVVRFHIKRYKKNKTFLSCIQYRIPVTKKPKGSRMGTGKGKIKKYISKINMNSILFIFKKIKL